ncbi:monooxygenase [Lewinellaceae bacterium SD302]|nr:monooxygenase [Lewinellaceae bacterium SD302]
MNFTSNARVAIIGAGCSGITTIKNFLDQGLTNIVCYEQNDQVGGNWIFSTEESHSSVCETTHIISSKTMSQYRDYPMPEHYPDYPSHRQMLAYFQHYAEHFGLLEYIRFSTRVEKAEKIEGERWLLTLSDGSREEFDFLLIANGHHNAPRHPEIIRRAFTGRYLHSHSYKTNASFRDERVLVIGSGNSGCDCAVEISRVTEKVDISIRRPRYIIPKFFLGRPTDTFNKMAMYLPGFLAERVRKLGLRIQIGKYEDYGLETPKTPVRAIHPTLNSELLYKIRHGKVVPRKGVKKVVDKTVHFTDGSQEEYDTIVAATGYKISLPFFAREFLNYEDADRIPLWLRMFHPEHPSLIFIGLFQPQGAVWPFSDYQAELAARYVNGSYEMPDDLGQRAEADSDEIEKEFAVGKQHTIEVHTHDFVRKLEKEIKKARKRVEI